MVTHQYSLIHNDSIVLVSLQEAKAQLRIENDFTEEDDLIQSYIDAAPKMLEQSTGAKIVESEITFFARNFAELLAMPELKVSPVQGINSLKYLDTAGGLQTVEVADDNFYLEQVANNTVRLAVDADFKVPETKDRFNGVQLVLKVGYASGQLPKDIKSCILLVIGWLYDKRTDSASKYPMATEKLMQTHKPYFQ